MKQRSREINIFNMSLLDILCGALGTFCFMMIVLFPYYSTKPKNAPEVPKDMIDPKTLQEALDQIKRLKEALDKQQAYAQNLEHQIDQLKKDAGKTNDRMGYLEMRNPFLAMIQFDRLTANDDVELFWDSDRVRSDQKAPYKVDPAQHQAKLFGGDFAVFGKGLAFSYHGIRDSPAGDYRLVFKVLKHDAGMPIRGWVHVAMADWVYVGPYIKTDKPQVVIPIARVKMGAAPEYRYTFEWTIPTDVNDEPGWKPDFPPK